MEELEKLRYPIGHFNCPTLVSEVDINEWIHVLETLPARLSNLVSSFTEAQLETPYRDGGWTPILKRIGAKCSMQKQLR
mgnify:CR=1 FL=1